MHDFGNSTSYSYSGGQIEWEMGLTRILEQSYQNSKIAKNAIFRVNFKGAYLLSHKELEGPQPIKLNLYELAFQCTWFHLISS